MSSCLVVGDHRRSSDSCPFDHDRASKTVHSFTIMSDQQQGGAGDGEF